MFKFTKIILSCLLIVLIGILLYEARLRAVDTTRLSDSQSQHTSTDGAESFDTMRVVLPSSYEEPLVIATFDFSLSLQPLEAMAAERSDEAENRFKYVDAYPHTDIVQTRSVHKLKEDIVLKSPGHPERFQYQLESQGMEGSFDEEGNLEFYSKSADVTAVKKMRMRIPAAYMTDAAGNKSRTTDVLMRYEKDVLTLIPSRAWLATAIYPVVVDPTVEITVLNVQSRPRVGGSWQVQFTSLGTADLSITGMTHELFHTNFDDDVSFASLLCGQNLASVFRVGNTLLVSDWSCESTGLFTVNVLKPGKHHLQFDFGGQIADAYNDTWWNASWTKRRKITFTNAAREAFTSFPILAALSDPTNISYSNTQAAGQDIRFVDSDDTTQLDHEIESWNESGSSYVWVEVPTIDQSDTDFIWMYYGYASATDGQNVSGTWESNYTTVWHMDGTGTTLTDSTSSPTSPTIHASWGWESTSKISDGLTWTAAGTGTSRFEGSGQNDGVDWTVEFWYKGTAVPPAECAFNDSFVVYSNQWDGLTVGAFHDVDPPTVKYIDWTNYNDLNRDDNGTNFGNGVFDHYVLNADWNGGGAGTSRLRIFKNGAFQATFDKTNDPAPQSIKLGTEDGICQFGASVDEFRVSSSIRSDNWVDMTYDQVENNSTVNVYGSEETYSAARTVPDVKFR